MSRYLLSGLIIMTLAAQAGVAQSMSTTKTCVAELKPTTQTVYGMVCKDYCRPGCSMFSFLKKCWGCDSCDCGTLHTRRVLTKKVVPDCPKVQCELKEVPFICETPGPVPIPKP